MRRLRIFNEAYREMGPRWIMLLSEWLTKAKISELRSMDARHLVAEFTTIFGATSYWVDWDNQRFVATYNDDEGKISNYWFSKYRCEMPEAVYPIPIQTIGAHTFLYEWEMDLAEHDLTRLNRVVDSSDFTMEMAWHLFSFLNWKPFSVVSVQDKGWESIAIQDEICVGYLDICRDVIGMPELSFNEMWKLRENLAARYNITSESVSNMLQ